MLGTLKTHAILCLILAILCELMLAPIRTGIWLWHARQARTWPIVEGTVISAEPVWQRRQYDGPWTMPMRGASHRNRVLRVTYEYRVAERAYRSSQHSYLGRLPDASDGRSVSRFAVGSRVPVHVDPSAPSRAVLEPGTPGRSTMEILLVHFALPAGVVLLAPLLPRRRWWRE